ncbi:MAG: alanine--tRNA ligase-related protein [Candidatus Heimdallarchaeaceae archaeon]
MQSVPLFWQAPYQRDVITPIIKTENNNLLLEDTCFYPGGGGQPFDTGLLVYQEYEFPIVEVFKDSEGNIWHKISNKDGVVLKEGQKVMLKLNWQRRYSLMKTHTAQHLVSHFLKKLYDIDTLKANFFEGEEMEIELSKEIKLEQLEEVLRQANSTLRQNVEVKSIIVDQDTFQKEYKNKVRGKKSTEKTVRMIQLGDFDLVCCGGLHVKNLSEIGGIYFEEVKKTKCKLLVNLKGLHYANQRCILLSSLETITTKKGKKLIQFVEGKMQVAEQLSDTAVELLKVLFQQANVFGEKVAGCSLIFLETYVERNLLLTAAKNLSPESIIFIHSGNVLYILSSVTTIPANELAKKMMEKFNTKGGGNKHFAQLNVLEKEKNELYELAKELVGN